MPKLVILSQGFTGQTHEMTADTTTIGRTDDNTVTIPEGSVSSRHCEILRRGEEYYVKDLDSTNGTYINGQKINSSPLKSGQILRCGQIEMRLESGDGQKPAEKLDQTVVIPKGREGVSLSDISQGGDTAAFTKDGPFKKQSDKTTRLWIVAASVLGVLIVALLIFALAKIK